MLGLAQRDRQTARDEIMKRIAIFAIGLFFGGSVIVSEACGSNDSASPGAPGNADGGGDTGSSTGDGGARDAEPSGDGGACTHNGATADDRVRNVLISKPFAASGDPATLFEVLSLAVDGTLTRTGVTFAMGTASTSAIQFTPDGKIAMVAQDDGSIGVVRFDASGPVVVHTALKGAFYAGAIAIDATGSRAYVLDGDTTNNGGGVYAFDIGCDGTLSPRGLVVPGSTANQMAFIPGSSRAVLSAGAAFDSPDGSDTDLVDFSGATPALVASGSGFVDGGAIVSSITVMPDGKFALAADNGIIVGNRLAAIAIPSMKNAGIIATGNPALVLASPYDNAALILNSDTADAIRVATYDSTATPPFTMVGQINYVFPKPQLPSYASLIGRGSLKGRVLIAENTAVRQVAFEPDAGIVDVAFLNFDQDGGLDQIVGVIGVEP